MKPTTQGVFDKRGATFGNLVFRKPPHSDSQAGYLSPSLQRIQGHRFLARPAPDPTRSLAVSIKHFSSRRSHELYPHTLCSLMLQQDEGQQQRFAFPKVALSDSQAGYLSPSPGRIVGYRFPARPAPDPTRSRVSSTSRRAAATSSTPHNLCSHTLQQGGGSKTPTKE